MPLKLKHSTIALFKYDSKVQNCQELQDVINHLFRWSVEWGMSFEIEKCSVLSINQSNQHQPFKYTMNDVTLSTINEVKDLGIFLDTKLSRVKHIRNIIANARKLTGLIKRTVGQSAHFYSHAPAWIWYTSIELPFVVSDTDIGTNSEILY